MTEESGGTTDVDTRATDVDARLSEVDTEATEISTRPIDVDTHTTPSERRPYRIMRAVLVAMPLAILVGAVLSTDPLIQVLAIALAFVVVFPIANRIARKRRLQTRDFALFLVLVLLFVTTGLWALPRVIGGPSSELARLVAIAIGVVLSAVAVRFVNRRAG